MGDVTAISILLFLSPQNMKRIIQLLVCLAFVDTGAHAQDSFEEYKKRVNNEMQTYKQKVEQDFEAYRRKVNEEFADYMRNAWVRMNPKPEIPKPKDDKPIPPVIYDKPKDDKPVVKDTPVKDNVVPVPKPEPQPTPIVPIEEQVQPEDRYTLSYLGNSMKLRVPDDYRFTLKNCSENTIADAWKKLSAGSYDNTIADLLRLRTDHKLCDWAYLCLLKTLSYALLGNRSNEATLLTAYLYTQSGYMMRLAQSGNRLCMLYGSKFMLYNQPYLELDGYFYYNMDGNETSLSVCNIKFPKEQALSLYITHEPDAPYVGCPSRTLQSNAYPEMRFTVSTNKNLIDFYNNYPTGKIGSNECTRWAVYANTPINAQTRNKLYPALQAVLKNRSQADAANMLLNFVQTALVYEYDDKVWGCDRAFFPEETLHYPYADCEDRAILFTRLVRDLLHLKTALVFYPGHLASAVKVTDPDIEGDFLNINGERYLVCDPTFINAPIGCTMPGMDNNKAKVILLD